MQYAENYFTKVEYFLVCKIIVSLVVIKVICKKVKSKKERIDLARTGTQTLCPIFGNLCNGG